GTDPLLPAALDDASRSDRLGADQSRILRHARRQSGQTLLRPLLHQEHVDRPGPVDPFPDHQDPRAGAGRPIAMHSWNLAAGIFWACTLLIVYTYVGYPLVLLVFYSLTQMARDLRYVLGRQDRRVEDRNDYEPRVSFVIAAYNEEGDLPAKLRNLAETDYPPAKLEILCVSDGSTDRTAEILRT